MSTAYRLLAERWPALAVYCPILPDVSAPQTAFLVLDCAEALYGGAVGGGKTAALLMAALQYADVPGYAALILRRTFPELEQPDGPIPQSLRWFAQAPAHLRPSYNRSDHEWRFPSGAVLRFGHLDHPNSMIRYQGGGYHYFGFDELTHFEEQPYEFIGFSRSRRPTKGPLARVPMRIRASANPGGPGHIWVKRRFIDERDPATMFVPAKLRDNPGIDYDDYVSRLQRMSPTLVEQLLNGDWGAFEGAAYPEFGETHVVPEVVVPDDWRRFECMDYGISNPTCFLAVASDYDGNLVVFDSYYGPGLVSRHAAEVLRKRRVWWPRGVDNRRLWLPECYCDPSIWNSTGAETRWGAPASVATEFDEHGVDGLLRGNNDRAAGFARILELVRPDPERFFPRWHERYGERGSPRLFVVGDRCQELVEQLRAAPILPIDGGLKGAGELVDPKWESAHGHAHAALRYGVLSWPGVSTQQPVLSDDPRELAIARLTGAATLDGMDDEPDYLY